MSVIVILIVVLVSITVPSMQMDFLLALILTVLLMTSVFYDLNVIMPTH